MTQEFIVGCYYVQIGFRDSSGYFKGQETAPDSIAVNTTTHSYVMMNPVEFQHAQPTFEQATDRGGQKIRAQVDLGPSDLGSGTFTLSEFDDVFHAYIRATSVDSTSVSAWRQVAGNINEVSPPAFFMIVSTKAAVVSSTGDVTNKWSHWVYPNVQIRPAFPQASQNGGVNPNPLQYTYIPSSSKRRWDARTFLAAMPTVEDNMDTVYHIESASPLTATTYIKNGAATTFTLGYRPTTSDATGAATNSITNNGVTEAVTSVSTTTGLVTLSAAGTSGHIMVAVYETNYVAI